MAGGSEVEDIKTAKTNVSTGSRNTTGTGERMAMAARKPNPIDVHVGSRVRMRRMFIGMSQERLGEQMDLTFQQIQKYEKGTNRIGASRLFQLADILKVPVGFFFEGLDAVTAQQPQAGFAEASSESYVMDFLDSREGIELNRAFVKIRDPKVRKSIVELVRALAEAEPGKD